MQDRTAEHDLIRAIANALRRVREFGRQIPSETRARAVLFRVLKRRCGYPEATLRKHLVTHRGGRSSLKALTFKHSKLPLRLWLAAVWHLHVDEQSIAARVFGRRYGIDKMSAWRLLARVRGTFILFTPCTGAARRKTLGRQAPSNTAWCASTLDEGRLFMVDSVDAPPSRRGHAVGSLFSGYFDRWLASQFRGIAERNHAHYGAEYADRHLRRWVNASHREVALLSPTC